MTDFRDHFPSFIWLLRDATLQIASETGKELSPSEYLKTQVLHRSKKLLPTDTDRIAMAILTYFPSVECHVLPPPSADTTVLQNISQNEDKLSNDFNTCMQNFVQHVHQNISAKKGFTANPVDGSTLALLADTYIKAVNCPENITTLEGSWNVVVSLKLKELQERLVSDYKSEMEATLNKTMPVELYPACEEDETKALLTVHEEIFRSKWKIFEDEVNCLMSHCKTSDLISKKEKVLHDFKCQIVEYNREATPTHRIVGGILKYFIDENYRRSSEYCRMLIHQHHGSSFNEETREIHTGTHGALDFVTKIKERYDAEACGPAKHHVYISELPGLQQSSEYIRQMASAHSTLQFALNEEGVARQQESELTLKLNELQHEVKRNADELNEYAADCDRNIEKLRNEVYETLLAEQMKQEEFMQSDMGLAVEASHEKCRDLQKELQEIEQLQKETKKEQERNLDQLLKGMIYHEEVILFYM